MYFTKKKAITCLKRHNWSQNCENKTKEVLHLLYITILKPVEFQVAEIPSEQGYASKGWWIQWEKGSQEIHKDKSSAQHRHGVGTHTVRNSYT